MIRVNVIFLINKISLTSIFEIFKEDLFIPLAHAVYHGYE